MSDDEKCIITPDEAASLLPEGDVIHNFVQADFMFIGADYDRADAIEAFRKAKSIEIGGVACKRMKHPIVAWRTDRDYSFFEADMVKVAAFETERAQRSQSDVSEGVNSK